MMGYSVNDCFGNFARKKSMAICVKHGKNQLDTSKIIKTLAETIVSSGTSDARKTSSSFELSSSPFLEPDNVFLRLNILTQMCETHKNHVFKKI